MKIRRAFQRFYVDPFGFVDQLTLTLDSKNKFFGVINPFSRWRTNRKLAFMVAIFVGVLPWFFFGFDSCIAQPIYCIYKLPQVLTGQMTLADLGRTWNGYYGREMHYSAFLIYGLMFWGLSRYYDKKLGITGSKNVCYAVGITLLSIAIFEFTWMFSFAVFQNQPWVLKLQFPQLKIVNQNINFTIVGSIAFLYMYIDSYVLWKPPGVKLKQAWRITRRYKFRLNKLGYILVFSTVSLWVFWWYYPGYIKQVTVPLDNGEVWVNSNRFPQTLYTIDVKPEDGVNAGKWTYVENDWIHGLNTLTKIILTMTIGYIAMPRKEVIKRDEENL